MKNATEDINTNTHYFFSKETTELVDEFKSFIAQVNEYLAKLRQDTRYHASNTRGKSKCRHITIEDGDWKFFGELLRENQPYTDKAVFYYRGTEIWDMTRKSQPTNDSYQRGEDVLVCLQNAATHYNKDKPWCGPSSYHDADTKLNYNASYAGTDDHFVIEETVRDKHGILLWMATCEGGYSV